MNARSPEPGSTPATASTARATMSTGAVSAAAMRLSSACPNPPVDQPAARPTSTPRASRTPATMPTIASVGLTAQSSKLKMSRPRSSSTSRSSELRCC